MLGITENDAPKVLSFQNSKEFKIKGSVSVKESIKEEQKRAQLLIAQAKAKRDQFMKSRIID